MLNGVDYYVIGTGATFAGVDKYGDNIYNYDSIYYEQNRQALISAFGMSNCHNDYLFECSVPIDDDTKISAGVAQNGNIFSGIEPLRGCGGFSCSVEDDGRSFCRQNSC